MSLPQKGPADEPRTEAETELFSRALGGMSSFYAHPYTTVLRVTQMPAHYPRGFHFPAGSTPNLASYDLRGW